jgi:hypothetical protein
MKLQTENDLLTMEINRCHKDYFANKCEPHQRVPALEDYCNEKAKCMNRDPMIVNKNMKILVKLLAEIINDFFEPLTYKAIGVIVLSLLVFIMFSECILSKRAI